MVRDIPLGYTIFEYYFLFSNRNASISFASNIFLFKIILHCLYSNIRPPIRRVAAHAYEKDQIGRVSALRVRLFENDELNEHSTCANFAQAADNGKTYQYKFYALAAIIAVGYRTNSERALQFRQWATKVLETFAKQGYVLDKNRLLNGQIFDEDYFDLLISEIQEIRASERRFYQKITDIYAAAVDYFVDSKITRDFFATVQNKMHYAIRGNTAAEVIVERADHCKEHMGLTAWKNAPRGKIVKADVSIAKNYLSAEEMQELNEIVTMYLDYATRQVRRLIPMTMADWANKIDAFLQFNDAEILHDKGKVTADIAKTFAESEFEKYRILQDKHYQSDFDRLFNESKEK